MPAKRGKKHDAATGSGGNSGEKVVMKSFAEIMQQKKKERSGVNNKKNMKAANSAKGASNAANNTQPAVPTSARRLTGGGAARGRGRGRGRGGSALTQRASVVATPAPATTAKKTASTRGKRKRGRLGLIRSGSLQDVDTTEVVTAPVDNSQPDTMMVDETSSNATTVDPANSLLSNKRAKINPKPQQQRLQRNLIPATIVAEEAEEETMANNKIDLTNSEPSSAAVTVSSDDAHVSRVEAILAAIEAQCGDELRDLVSNSNIAKGPTSSEKLNELETFFQQEALRQF